MIELHIAEDAMDRAIVLAGRSPQNDANPPVGCVLIDPEGRIVSEGWHRGAGTAHAEVDALNHLPASWQNDTRQLTAVVTLEPCNHTGRTPPCAHALRVAGIGAVVYGQSDPGAASGGGADYLQSHGISVLGGVRAFATGILLRPWLQRKTEIPRLGPRIIVKWAQSLDGRAAATDMTSQWITSSVARADVHQRRADADAIVIGTGTLIADDPQLTVRSANGSLAVPASDQPLPVIFGTTPIPERSQVLNHPALTAHDLSTPWQFDGKNLAADLEDLISRLGSDTTIWVEGGPTLASAFIREQLATEILVYTAPVLLGGPMLALTDVGVETITDQRRLDVVDTLQLGKDWLVHAVPSPQKGRSDVHGTR